MIGSSAVIMFSYSVAWLENLEEEIKDVVFKCICASACIVVILCLREIDWIRFQSFYIDPPLSFYFYSHNYKPIQTNMN